MWHKIPLHAQYLVNIIIDFRFERFSIQTVASSMAVSMMIHKNIFQMVYYVWSLGL